MKDIGYVNVLQQLNDFRLELFELFSKLNGLTKDPYQSLLLELDQIIENLSDPVIGQPIDNLQLMPKELLEIDKLGLGELISVYIQNNMTPSTISKSLGLLGFSVTTSDINKWINSVNSSGILDRGEISGYGSIFDAEVQLQGVFERLKELEISTDNNNDEVFKSARTTRELVQREILSEQRQAIKDGVAITKAISQKQSFETFKRIMIEEINKESTEVAVRIWHRLKESRDSLRVFNFS
jgi:hypothetical protein